MLVEKPTGAIRTAYDLNNDPYLFEAIGTEAKRFIDILNADDEGRLIVLPCKVGDTVYSPEDPRSKEITTISVDKYGIHCEWIQYDVGPETCELWDDGWFDADEIGKTVFLTREEAEAALGGDRDA